MAVGQGCDGIVVQPVAKAAVQARDANALADGRDGVPQRARGGNAIHFGKRAEFDRHRTRGNGSGEERYSGAAIYRSVENPQQRRR